METYFTILFAVVVRKFLPSPLPRGLYAVCCAALSSFAPDCKSYSVDHNIILSNIVKNCHVRWTNSRISHD